MFGFFKQLGISGSFLKQAIAPQYLGVDIGTTSIKIVETKQGKRLPQLVNYAFLEANDYLGRTNSALQTSTMKLFEEDVVDILKKVISEMKPQTNVAIASLPVFSVFLTVRDFPEMSAADLKKALPFQARQATPLPISEVEFEWLPAGSYEDEKGYRHQQVLLIFFPREHIEKYRRIFTKAGLKLEAIEIESLSLARVLAGTDPTPTVIVDIGSRSTNIAFVDGGALRFNSQTDFAGASLSQALAAGLNINPLRAEELKKERGIGAGGADYELSTIMLPFLDVIINEIKKADFNYHTQFPAAKKMERVVLTGGSAAMTGIEKYFGREFEIPVVRGAPLMRVEYPVAIEPFAAELNAALGVALGLGIREFVQ